MLEQQECVAAGNANLRLAVPVEIGNHRRPAGHRSRQSGTGQGIAVAVENVEAVAAGQDDLGVGIRVQVGNGGITIGEIIAIKANTAIPVVHGIAGNDLPLTVQVDIGHLHQCAVGEALLTAAGHFRLAQDNAIGTHDSHAASAAVVAQPQKNLGAAIGVQIGDGDAVCTAVLSSETL